MWDRVTVKAPARALPITSAELRRRLRVDESGLPAEDAAEDDLLVDCFRSALGEIEGPKGKGLALMSQTWTRTLDGFHDGRRDGGLVLPGAPVKGVEAVRYLDPTGAPHVLDAAGYRLDLGGDRAILRPAFGSRWPASAADPQAVEIDYTLGVSDPDDVRSDLVNAAALIAGHLYENREEVIVGQPAHVIPRGAASILARHARGASG